MKLKIKEEQEYEERCARALAARWALEDPAEAPWRDQARRVEDADEHSD